jgi:hypothetical protein
MTTQSLPYAHLGEALATDYFQVREQFTDEQRNYFITLTTTALSKEAGRAREVVGQLARKDGRRLSLDPERRRRLTAALATAAGRRRSRGMDAARVPVEPMRQFAQAFFRVAPLRVDVAPDRNRGSAAAPASRSAAAALWALAPVVQVSSTRRTQLSSRRRETVHFSRSNARSATGLVLRARTRS